MTIGVLIRRPGLTPEALRVVWALRSRGESRRRYLEWRTITAYGDLDHEMTQNEMVDFLEWRRRLRRLR